MKRKIMIVLVITLLLTQFPLTFNAVNAYTARTQQEALDWAWSQQGKVLDWPNSGYGAQCIDLICYYYDYLGVPIVWGNAKDYSWKPVPEGWSRPNAPQPGDVAVSTNGTYGHIAIVISVNGNQITAMDQNTRGWNKEGYTADPVAHRTWNTSYFTHYIRPDFKGGGSPTPSQDYGENRYFTKEFIGRIQNVHSGKVLFNNNKKIEIRTPNGDSRELFLISGSSSPTKIISCYDGKSLDIAWASDQSGTDVQTMPYNGNPAQVWRFYEKNGHYVIKADCTRCVLDVENGSASDGAAVLSNNFTASNSQLWDFYTQSDSYDLGTNFYAKIQNHRNGMAITNTGSNLIINSLSGEDDQLFHFTSMGDGSYKITSKKDGKSLDVNNASPAHGENVHPWDVNGTDAQKWRIYRKDNSYILAADCSPCVLDIHNGESYDGTNVLMYYPSGTSSQMWDIFKENVRKMDTPNLLYDIDSNGIVRFSWQDVGDEDYYILTLARTDIDSPDQEFRIGKNETLKECTLEPGNYSAILTAINSNEKKFSKVNFTIESSLPKITAPILEVTPLSGGTVRFDWSNTEGADKYELAVWNTDYSVSTLYDLNANIHSKELTFRPGTYFAMISALNATNKETSAVVEFIISGEQDQDGEMFEIESLLSQSDKIPPKTTFDRNKEWNVRFNKNIFIKNPKKIYLLDEEGKSIKSECYMSSSNVLTVRSVISFSPGKNYYLYIKKDAVISESYNALLKDVLFMFILSE